MMRLIAYHTTDPFYSADARLLAECARYYDLPLHLEAMPPDKWQRATQHKARFVRDCLAKFPGQRLVYIDVDSVLIRSPVLLSTVECDIAAVYYANELLSGVVVFSGSPKSVEVVDAWIAANQTHPDYLPNGQEAWDQRTLAMVLGQVQDVHFVRLPVEYNFIPALTTKQYPDCVSPVIVSTRGSFRANPKHE
jgi:hypothetical protein